MKRFLYFLLAASMLATIGCSGDNTVSSTPTGKDVLNGTLRDPATNEPIVGAIIKNGKKSCRTDATGNWTLGGFTETTAVTNSIAPMFMVSITNLPAEYPVQVFRTVGVSQSILGPNDLTIGKLNATVRGMVLNVDGSAAVGATVYLTYIPDGHSGTLSLSAIGTAFSTTVPVLTGADGRFVIEDIETGALVFPTAQSADGQYTTGGILRTVHLPLIDAYTTNLTTLQFAATPDTNQPLAIISPTISVNGGPFVTGVNTGEFDFGPTTVKFQLNKPIAHTAYTDSTLVTNDAYVNGVAKGGNVPFTITYDNDASTGYITAINVNFITGNSMIYTINLGNRTDATSTVVADSFLGKIGVTVGDSSRIIFATDTGSIPSGAPALAVPGAGTYAGDSVVTWTPVANATAYRVFVERLDAGVSTGFVLATPVDLTVFTYDVSTFANFIGYFDGINIVTYNVKVYALGTDKVLDEALASTVVVRDTTRPIATTTAKPATYPVKAITKTTAAGTAEVFTGNLYAANQTMTVSFWADPAGLTTLEMMDKATVDAGAPAVVPAVAGTTLGTVAGGTAIDASAVYALTVTSWSYSQSTRLATLVYNISYTFTAPAADAAATAYTITAPLVQNWLLTLTGATDINGNALVYVQPNLVAPTGF